MILRDRRGRERKFSVVTVGDAEFMFEACLPEPLVGNEYVHAEQYVIRWWRPASMIPSCRHKPGPDPDLWIENGRFHRSEIEEAHLP